MPYPKQDIFSNSRKLYVKKNQFIEMVRPGIYKVPGFDAFPLADMDLISDEPIKDEVIEKIVTTDEEKELRKQLKSLIRKTPYNFRIIFNRVYFNKVAKFPKNIDKDKWLDIARKCWAESDFANDELLDKNKANQ